MIEKINVNLHGLGLARRDSQWNGPRNSETKTMLKTGSCTVDMM